MSAIHKSVYVLVIYEGDAENFWVQPTCQNMTKKPNISLGCG